MSLLKEPLYLFGTTLVITGAIASARADRHTIRAAGLTTAAAGLVFFSTSLRVKLAVAAATAILIFTITSQPAAQQRMTSALNTTAKTHTGHVFTVGHAYTLLDQGFYFNPISPSASSLTLTTAEAARYVIRAAVSFVTVPWPWQLASTRELTYLPEQLLWYAIVALLPIGLVAGWRRNRIVTSLLAGYTLPTAAALALTNGNVGTLLRLRGIVIPYLIWLSAVGFCAALQRLTTLSGRTATT
jgi:hypothetical protein